MTREQILAKLADVGRAKAQKQFELDLLSAQEKDLERQLQWPGESQKANPQTTKTTKPKPAKAEPEISPTELFIRENREHLLEDHVFFLRRDPEPSPADVADFLDMSSRQCLRLLETGVLRHGPNSKRYKGGRKTIDAISVVEYQLKDGKTEEI